MFRESRKKIVDFYEVPKNIFSPMQDLAQDPSIAAILALRSELVLFYVKIFFTHFFSKDSFDVLLPRKNMKFSATAHFLLFSAHFPDFWMAYRLFLAIHTIGGVLTVYGLRRAPGPSYSRYLAHRVIFSRHNSKQMAPRGDRQTKRKNKS